MKEDCRLPTRSYNIDLAGLGFIAPCKATQAAAGLRLRQEGLLGDRIYAVNVLFL